MKKIIPVLLALVLFFSMTAAVMAESFQLNTDRDTVSRGDKVTVNVTLDEDVSGQFRNVQGQLNYDPETVTYESHELGESYSNYTANDMPDRKYFTFTNTDFTDDGFSAISAGNVVSVTFKVGKNIKAEHLNTTFTLKLSMQDISGKTENLAADTSVLICTGQKNSGSTQTSADEDTGTDSQNQICDKCGKEYTVSEKKDADSGTDKDDGADAESKEQDAQNVGASSDNGDAAGGTDRATATVVIAAIAAAVIIICRKMIRK